MGDNLVYKILKSHIVEGELKAGEPVALKIDKTLTQDSTGTMAYLQLEAMGIDRVKTKKYRCLESTIEYKIELYKEKKKILTLKNSKIGFYNFFDEIKNKI